MHQVRLKSVFWRGLHHLTSEAIILEDDLQYKFLKLNCSFIFVFEQTVSIHVRPLTELISSHNVYLKYICMCIVNKIEHIMHI